MFLLSEGCLCGERKAREVALLNFLNPADPHCCAENGTEPSELAGAEEENATPVLTPAGTVAVHNAVAGARSALGGVG